MSVNTLTEFFEQYKFKHPLVYIHKGQGLSTYAERLIPLIALVIQQTDPDQKGMYWIDLKVAKAFVETSSHKRSYKPVLDAFEELFDIALSVNIFNQDKTFQDRKARIIYDRIVEGRSKGNLKRIGFAPHPEFVAKVQDPKVFAFYSIFMLAVLTEHKKSFTFYTICAGFWGCASKEERDTGKIKVTIPLTHLHAIFDVNGKYEQYKDFNKFLLKPVVMEVNKSSDFSIIYKGIRGKGRKIVEIELTIQVQPWQIPLPNVENLKRIAQIVSDSVLFKDVAKLPSVMNGEIENTVSETAEIVGDVSEWVDHINWAARYDISAPVIQRFIEKHGATAFEEIRTAFLKNMEASRMGKMPAVQNATKLLGRYLSDRIGVKTPDERQKEISRTEQMEIRKGKQKLLDALRKLKEKREELERLHRQECLQILEQLFATLEPAAEEAAATEFIARLNDYDRADFLRDRWGAVTLMHKVIDFTRQKFPRKLPTFTTLVKRETGNSLRVIDNEISRLENEIDNDRLL